MNLQYSTYSKKIESILLKDQFSSFKFKFSHKHLETLNSIYKLLKRKITLQGFCFNFQIKKMLGEGSHGKVRHSKN